MVLIKILIIIVIMLFINPININASQVKYSVEHSLSDSYVNYKDVTPVVYNRTNSAPLISNGELYGYVTIVDRRELIMHDWGIKSATDNSVDKSYIVTFRVDINRKQNFNVMSLEADMWLESNNNKISSKGSIGWSGIYDYATVYESNPTALVECILQPTTNDQYSKLVLCVKSNKIQFNPLEFDTEVLTELKAQKTKLNYGDPLKITYRDGSVLEYTIDNVYLSNVTSDKVKNVYSYDIEFSVKRIKLPKEKKDGRFTMPILTVNLASGINYNNTNPKAIRLVYSDSNTMETYVSIPDKVELGETVTGITNVIIGKELPINNGYTRVFFDFSTDAYKFKSEELIKFSGRNKVYELLLGERILKSRKEK